VSLLVAVCVALLLALASPASALVPTSIEANMPQVVEFLKEGSAHRDPSNSYLRAKERLAANTAQPTQLQRDLLGVRQRSTLLPKISGAIGRVSLVATAGVIGWQIGTGIRSKFIGMPRPPAVTIWDGLVPREYDEYIHAPDMTPDKLGRSVWRIEAGSYPYVWSGTAASDPDCTMRQLASFASGWQAEIYEPTNMCNANGVNTGNGRQAVSYLEMDGTLQDYNGQAVTFATGAGVEPSDAAVETQLRDDINADKVPTLTQWLDHQLGGPSSNPTSGPTVTVPSCAGDLYAACADKVTAANLVPARETLSFSGADVTKPADSVVSTTPASGAEADPQSTVTITSNPGPTTMPVLVPAIGAGQTYAQYLADLQARGLVGSRVELTDATLDPAKGPNAAVSAEPSTGTRVPPETVVKVRTNPETAPPVPVGGGGGPELHSINLAPLNVASACDNFPFGVPCWLVEVTESWVVGTSSAPSWEIPFPFVAEADRPSIDLADWNAYAPPLRALLLLVAAVGMALKFYALSTGQSRGGDGD